MRAAAEFRPVAVPGTRPREQNGSMRLRMQLLLILIGVVLGPLYVGYARFFSGSPVSTRELIDRHDQSAPGTPVPVTLQLRPAMNPVRISVEAEREGASRPGDERVSYAGRLMLRRTSVWQRIFTFDLGGGTGAHRDTVRLATLSVPVAGRYRLDIAPLGSSGAGLSSMALHVRRNVMVPDPRVYGAGLLLFFISIVWVLFANPATADFSDRASTRERSPSTGRPPGED